MPSHSVDVGRGAERRSSPEHERDLAMTAIAEETAAHPGKPVAAHRTAHSDTAVIYDTGRKRYGRDERHPPTRSLEPTRASPRTGKVDGEPVRAAPRPADDTPMNCVEDRWGNRGCARRPSENKDRSENSSQTHSAGIPLWPRAVRTVLEAKARTAEPGLARLSHNGVTSPTPASHSPPAGPETAESRQRTQGGGTRGEPGLPRDKGTSDAVPNLSP
jgi:hypothetical protein